jgi:hypothetical protein
MSRKVFTAGEVLAAADVNSFLMDQTVMSFAGTAARGSAIGTATEGMVTYLEDSDTIQIYDGAWRTSLATTGGILQVNQTLKNNAFSVATSAFTDITGLSVSITPKSASSKILVLVDLLVGASASADISFNLLRDSTNIAQGTGSTYNSSKTLRLSTATDLQSVALLCLDSPATVAATTYKIQTRLYNASTMYINRRGNDTEYSGVSAITVMEVAA